MQKQLSYESRKELAQLRASITLNASALTHPVVSAKDEWIDGISEPEDVGIQATPEVRVYKRVAVEQVGPLTILEPGNPFRAIPSGIEKTLIEDNGSVTRERLEMHDAEFAYVTRDESDTTIMLRWNQPDDVLDELEQIEANDERAVWVERMTAFRETQLRRLLREYFGESYMTREIVLRWEQKNGRWTPAEKMLVRDWVAAKIEEKGSRLSGFASCAGTIRSKLTRKRIANDKTGQSGSFVRVYNEV